MINPCGDITGNSSKLRQDFSEMKKIAIYLMFLMVFSALVGCQNTWLQPLQKADIVYLTYVKNNGKTSIGFVESGANVVLSEAGYFSMPAWSLDGRKLYGTVRSTAAYHLGYPAYIDSRGELKQCNRDLSWFGANLVEDIPDVGNVNRVLVVETRKIMTIDIEKCEILSMLVDVSQNGEMVINGASYSIYGKWLAYGLQTYHRTSFPTYELVMLNLDTQKTSMLATGINPTWSPDGTKITYVQSDGIYIINSDGSVARRLISHNFMNYSDGGFVAISPIPRWSSDGKWLIYHRCEMNSCMLEENTIYKVEISTGKEEKIVDGGAFPDWKNVP